MQAQAQAKLQALQPPLLQAAQQPAYQNGHQHVNMPSQFDKPQQLQFHQLSSMPPGNGSAPSYAQGSEHVYMQNGHAGFTSINPTSHPFQQNGGPAFQQNGGPSFASPVPSPLQSPNLMSHRPPGLPPPRLAPPPPLKPIPSDFGRGFGSNGVRQKRPHQDPEKVERTIFIENLPDAVDEQVAYLSLMQCSSLCPDCKAFLSATVSHCPRVFCPVNLPSLGWRSVLHAADMQAIADHFGISGEVTSVRVVSKGPGQTKAWVEYESPQQAVTAREHDQTVSSASFCKAPSSQLPVFKQENMAAKALYQGGACGHLQIILMSCTLLALTDCFM